MPGHMGKANSNYFVNAGRRFIRICAGSSDANESEGSGRGDTHGVDEKGPGGPWTLVGHSQYGWGAYRTMKLSGNATDTMNADVRCRPERLFFACRPMQAVATEKTLRGVGRESFGKAMIVEK